MSARAALLPALVVPLLALASCGKTGDLYPPEEQKGSFNWPQTYPEPANVLPSALPVPDTPPPAPPPAGAAPPEPVPEPVPELVPEVEDDRLEPLSDPRRTRTNTYRPQR